MTTYQKGRPLRGGFFGDETFCDTRLLPMEMDYGSRHFTLANWHSTANYHSAIPLLALADMSQPDKRSEANAPDGAEKRERGAVNSAARVRQILGPAIAARL